MVINKIVAARLELMACYQTDQSYLKKYLIVSLLDNNKICQSQNHDVVFFIISLL